MTKLLAISNTSFSIEKFRSHYLNKLSKDFEILVSTPQKKPKNLLNVKFKSLNSTNLIYEIFNIIHIIKTFKPDKIIVYSFRYQLIVSLINIFFKIELICLIAGKGSLFIHSNFILNIIKKIVIYSILKISNKIIFINPLDKNFFCTKFNIKKKTYLIFTEGLKISGILRKKKSSKNFIFFGRLIREKGIYDYIEAAKIIKKKHPNFNFFVSGPISKEKIGQSYIFTKNIKKYLFKNKNTIKYLGFNKNFKKIFYKMDCLISPSYSEGAGTSVMEAMMSGLFIIAYKNNGHQLILKKTNNYICKKNNIDEIVKGILYFANLKKKFLEKNSILSHKKVKDNYSSEKTYKILKKIISKKI